MTREHKQHEKDNRNHLPAIQVPIAQRIECETS